MHACPQLQKAWAAIKNHAENMKRFFLLYLLQNMSPITFANLKL